MVVLFSFGFNADAIDLMNNFVQCVSERYKVLDRLRVFVRLIAVRSYNGYFISELF